MKNYDKIISVIKQEILEVNKYIFECLSSNIYVLSDDLCNFLLKKSKKIRAAVSILFIKSKYGKISDKQLKILAITELIHNASLIHDDIIDDADVRRNEATINNLFGNGSAVIIGDYVLAIALKELINYENVNLTNLFINAMYEVCKGEFEQDIQRKKLSAIDEYIVKSRRKTAELFKTALSGALISENKYEVKEIAEQFTENFGIMFQIKNDLTNFLNQEKTFGFEKSDIDNGIYTAPVIYLCENAGVEEIKNITKDDKNLLYAAEKTQGLLNLYGVKILDLISSFPDNIYKSALIDLCMEVQKGKNDKN